MAWTDRLKEAVYISPSGVALRFDFEDVSRNFDKRTTAFETSGKDGTYIQDSGRGGRRFPMKIFLSGANYDLEANAFEEALGERGRGKLQHPLDGTFDVVPFGTISRLDALVTAGNQAIITVVFWETTDLFPTTQGDAGAALVASLDSFNQSMAAELAEDLDLGSAVEETTFIDEYEAILARVEDAMRPIAETQEDVRVKFEAVSSSISRGIDVLIDEPLALARQTLLLVQLPGQAATSITARLDGYNNLFQDLLERVGIQEKSDSDSRSSNRFHTADMYASGFVTGSVVSVLSHTFQTKPEALGAAEVILDQFAELVAWRDDNYASLEEVDTGESYQALQETVALTAGFLVDLSFSLKQERRITLTRGRSIIDLVAELYGEVDSQLDFFINSNNLTGSEILQVPAGREVVFYV